MERQTKMSKAKNEKEGFEMRSPLQHLNGLQIRKPNYKKTSNLSSSSSVSFEAMNGCRRLLLSSNSSSAFSSSSSSSTSSSRTHFHRKPKNLSTVTNNASLKSSAVALNARSKENEVPRKPFSQKSMKNQPPRHDDKKQYGKANTKPTIKNAQRRSKFCSAQRSSANIPKKGSRSCEENGSGEPNTKLFEVSDDINLDCIENCTPEGKIASVCGLDSSVSFDCSQNLKEESISNSDNAVKKTPPVEASVSPEIQCGSHSRMVVAKSTATPVCYGAGHLLSGVTDKRKCRRRGSLKGGFEKINLFDDEKNYENVISDLRDSLIPLPAEASVRWVLSPCDEGREDSENRLDQCEMIVESGTFGCDKSIKKMHEQTNNSALSLGSLSSGNIIQTPSLDTSSYGCLGGSNMDFVQFELDSITNQVQENVNSVCSWISDTTLLENLALSETRISWRDGFVSRTDDDNDEFDCCRCLSDEEIDGDVCSDKQLFPVSQSGEGVKQNDLANNGCCLRSRLGTECGKDEESDPRIYGDEYDKPCVFAQGKEYENLSSSHGLLNESAESICTNGGELVASGDSDWMYFRENDFIRIS